ncbi:unnamed protein product [Amoebophrya sp. A25]|nr:unnamed protein product [Amoebophrya sp. A25]|eukprot:GSA25T00001542001.1
MWLNRFQYGGIFKKRWGERIGNETVAHGLSGSSVLTKLPDAGLASNRNPESGSELPTEGALGTALLGKSDVGFLMPLNQGRAALFDQFTMNVRAAIDSDEIGPKQIVPFSVSSLLAARFFQARSWHPDVVFLDSAHEADETYIELCLWWRILPPGGILLGDDLLWDAVRKDVIRFVEERDLESHFMLTSVDWRSSSGNREEEQVRQWISSWETIKYSRFTMLFTKYLQAEGNDDVWFIQKPGR